MKHCQGDTQVYMALWMFNQLANSQFMKVLKYQEITLPSKQLGGSCCKIVMDYLKQKHKQDISIWYCPNLFEP